MLLTLIYSSTIIEEILKLCKDNSGSALAYFYFDFQNRDQQQCESLLRSLIAQFSDQAPDTPEALQELHSRCQSSRHGPDSGDLTTTLQCIVQEFRHAYIVVDALDECTERESLLELIEEIVDWKSSTLHILVTSRKEREIEDSLIPRCWHTMALQDSVIAGDIEIHVCEKLQNDPKLKKWSAKVQAEIKEKLTQGACGM